MCAWFTRVRRDDGSSTKIFFKITRKISTPDIARKIWQEFCSIFRRNSKTSDVRKLNKSAIVKVGVHLYFAHTPLVVTVWKSLTLLYMYYCFQNGSTPLIVASRKGHLQTVNVLVSRGADFESKTQVRALCKSYMYLWNSRAFCESPNYNAENVCMLYTVFCWEGACKCSYSYCKSSERKNSADKICGTRWRNRKQHEQHIEKYDNLLPPPTIIAQFSLENTTTERQACLSSYKTYWQRTRESR